MSSRNRRSLRNSGEPGKKNVAEEAPKQIEETQSKITTKRRSLRVSPNTASLSPPSKVRCLRPSPSSSKSQKPKTTPSPPTRRTRKNCSPIPNAVANSTNGRNSKANSPKLATEKSTNGTVNTTAKLKGKKPSPKKKSLNSQTLDGEIKLTNGPASNHTTPVRKRTSRKRQRSPPQESQPKVSPTIRKSKRTKFQSDKSTTKQSEQESANVSNHANGHSGTQTTKPAAQKRKRRSPEPVVVIERLKKSKQLPQFEEVVESKPITDALSTPIIKDSSFILSKESNVTVILPMKETFAEHFLGEILTNHDQKEEVLSLIPDEMRSLEKAKLVKFLVEKLLSSDVALKKMTSPRFNKFLRSLLNIFCTTDSSVDCKHQLCESALEWAAEKKSINLKHEIESSLMNLYYETKFYRKAEETANVLYAATKKLQDKEKNVQACLCLSKTYHAMGNISKARANITTAKTEALKIYTPPDLQAELDLQSGIMQIAEEKDMETAFSYFKEAATGSTDKVKRSRALKYMLLSKLLVNRPEEGEKAVQTPAHIKDIDEGVEALLHITKAAISSSLTIFTEAVTKYESELKEDLVVKHEIDHLYSKMLEKNLITIIQPYSRMQITCIAEKIGLSCVEIEKRLSQLILDGQLQAQLDHRDNCLYVYQPEVKDTVYPSALETISHLDRSLSLLNRKVKQLL